MILSVALALGLLAMVAVRGAATFRPRPIDRVELHDGSAFLGVPMDEEPFTPTGAFADSLASFRASGATPIDGTFDPRGRPVRRLYRVANREVMPEPFRWVPLWEVRAVTRPRDAAFVERAEWGAWLGTPRAVFEQDILRLPPDQPWPAEEHTPRGRVTREKIGEEDGLVLVRQRLYLAEGPDAVWNALPEALALARERLRQIRRLDREELGAANRAIESWRLRLRQAELEHARRLSAPPPLLSPPLWTLALLGAAAATLAAVILHRRRGPLAHLTPLCGAAAAGLALFAAIEHPWSVPAMDEQRLAQVRARADAALADLQSRYADTLARLEELRRHDARFRVEFVDATFGQPAAERPGRPDEPLLLSQVVRAVRANDLSALDHAAVYLSRWREYLLDEPRSNNTEGGVFPVIFGTVLLTILLSVVTVPLGVIAALYLREYARQGPLTSLIRIAVNNLAGVPSIVYGVFGLGFFCYGVGAFIDAGPRHPLPRLPWWWLVGGACLVTALAAVCVGLARRRPGQEPARRDRALVWLAAMLWFSAAGLALAALTSTPYFHGLFRAKLPSPTFGTPGLLWASLTLALLTLPVVIVATEEALAAVPRSMREGSFGCGASHWQTIRRIVLPAAAPGVMTGAILAMARGAGEVAPLMLVGAVKLASELPLDTHPPFLHPQRSFMHLGFHIYDLGFQSPDSEAAQPLVWTTTLLLVSVVLALNLAAITIRARIRARLAGGTF
jgi:ABC-type phosphate transport system permease subunit